MIAVIGTGLWGENLVRTLSAMGVLSAICDQNQDRAQALSQAYGVPAWPLETILKMPEIKGVCISTPATSHSFMARQALSNDKHIFVEKPFTLSVEDAENLIQLAQEKNRHIMVGHVIRYHPAFQKLAQGVESGDLGDVIFIDAIRHNWGRVCPQERDVFWSLSVHDLSLVLAIAKNDVEDVTYLGQSFETPIDQGMIGLRFKNGIRARILGSWCYPLKEQRFIVMGTKGVYVLDDTAPAGEELLFAQHTSPQPSLEKPPLSFSLIPYDATLSPLKAECEAFVNAIQTGRPPCTDGAESLRILRVLERLTPQNSEAL